MQRRYDVLVIGAGPAGAAASIAAARAGARVCALDRAHFPRPKVCGDAISNSAVTLVEELGAGERLRRAPQAVVRGAVAIFPDGSQVKRSYGAKPGLIVERFEFDRLLRDQLERTGASVQEGVKVRLVEERGRVVGAEADGASFRADAVIAADGPGSVAWSTLGQAAPRNAALALAATAYYTGVETDASFSEHYFEAELPCGYGWIFPSVLGRANVGVYQRADLYQRARVPLRRLLDDFIARHPERFAGAERAAHVRSWQLPLATPKPPSAAAGVLRLTGEGIWHALHSGRLAGLSAVEALSTGGLDAAAARRYRLRAAREVGWPSALRIGIQQSMKLVVGLGLYRSSAVRSLLEWGYGRSALEISKAVG
jgi:geranylgeranyl reductase family protein